MRKSAYFSDLIFAFCAASLPALCFLRFYRIPLFWAILAALLFGIGITLIVAQGMRKRFSSRALKASEMREREMLSLHLAMLSEREQTAFFAERAETVLGEPITEKSKFEILSLRYASLQNDSVRLDFAMGQGEERKQEVGSGERLTREQGATSGRGKENEQEATSGRGAENEQGATSGRGKEIEQEATSGRGAENEQGATSGRETENEQGATSGRGTENEQGATSGQEMAGRLDFSGGRFLETATMVAYCRFRATALSADDTLPILTHPTDKTPLLLCNALNDEAKNLVSRFGLRFIGIDEIYAKLKKAELLPDKYRSEPAFTKRKTRIFSGFSKKNARPFFTGGAMVLVASLYSPFPYYYLVFGIALTAISVLVKMFARKE